MEISSTRVEVFGSDKHFNKVQKCELQCYTMENINWEDAKVKYSQVELF